MITVLLAAVVDHCGSELDIGRPLVGSRQLNKDFTLATMGSPVPLLAAATVAKSVAMMGAFSALRGFVDPLYANPQCALRLVNESDPQAYAIHPFWNGLTYDDSCAGQRLDAYVSNQSSKVEAFWQVTLTKMWTCLGLLGIVWQICTRVLPKGIAGVGRSLPGGLVSCALSFAAGTVVLMHSHFEQDVTFMTGAIIHHAFADKPGLDEKGGSVSQGYLICGMLNRAFYSLVLYALIRSNKRLRAALNPVVMVGGVQVFIWVAVTTVKKKHPIYHEMVNNGTYVEAMESAWPYSLEWRAYYHAVVHHRSGESFSGDLFLDPVYDAQLYGHAFLHNDVLGITMGSGAHYVFSTIADMVMGGVGILVLFVYLHIGAFAVRVVAQEADEAASKGGSSSVSPRRSARIKSKKTE